jgi:hypothetical protein
LALLALTGCELLADLDARKLDPIREGCTLPADGDARIRLANLRPDPGLVDFCVRTRGERYRRPVLRGAGSACPAGYRYEDVSAPFAVRAGSIDVKMIAAGSTCADPALSSLDGVAVDGSSVVTIVSVGGSATPARLLALPEEPTPDDSQLRLRFVNASAASAPLYLGPTTASTLPTRVATRMLADSVPFGAVPSGGSATSTGAIDERGYWSLAPLRYQLGAATDADDGALLAFSMSERAATYTLFAIGDPADPTFPLRGLLCDETTKAGGLTLPCSETALGLTDVVDPLDPDAGGSPRAPSLDAAAASVSDAALGGGAEADARASGMTITMPATDAATPGQGAPPAVTEPPTQLADAGVPAAGDNEIGLSAQYQVNQLAVSEFMVAPVLQIRNLSIREGVPLRTLKLRYYFTNEHSDRCPDNCAIEAYYANLSLGTVVAVERRYVQLEGALAYLEISFENEPAVLHKGEAVQTYQGFHISPYLPLDQSDDYSYDGSQTSYVDWRKIALYKDDVLVWGTPPK